MPPRIPRNWRDHQSHQYISRRMLSARSAIRRFHPHTECRRKVPRYTSATNHRRFHTPRNVPGCRASGRRHHTPSALPQAAPLHQGIRYRHRHSPYTSASSDMTRRRPRSSQHPTSNRHTCRCTISALRCRTSFRRRPPPDTPRPPCRRRDNRRSFRDPGSRRCTRRHTISALRYRTSFRHRRPPDTPRPPCRRCDNRRSFRDPTPYPYKSRDTPHPSHIRPVPPPHTHRPCKPRTKDTPCHTCRSEADWTPHLQDTRPHSTPPHSTPPHTTPRPRCTSSDRTSHASRTRRPDSRYSPSYSQDTGTHFRHNTYCPNTPSRTRRNAPRRASNQSISARLRNTCIHFGRPPNIRPGDKPPHPRNAYRSLRNDSGLWSRRHRLRCNTVVERCTCPLPDGTPRQRKAPRTDMTPRIPRNSPHPASHPRTPRRNRPPRNIRCRKSHIRPRTPADGRPVSHHRCMMQGKHTPPRTQPKNRNVLFSLLYLLVIYFTQSIFSPQAHHNNVLQRG